MPLGRVSSERTRPVKHPTLAESVVFNTGSARAHRIPMPAQSIGGQTSFGKQFLGRAQEGERLRLAHRRWRRGARENPIRRVSPCRLRLHRIKLIAQLRQDDMQAARSVGPRRQRSSTASSRPRTSMASPTSRTTDWIRTASTARTRPPRSVRTVASSEHELARATVPARPIAMAAIRLRNLEKRSRTAES
jgi:hypothetical protein